MNKCIFHELYKNRAPLRHTETFHSLPHKFMKHVRNFQLQLWLYFVYCRPCKWKCTFLRRNDPINMLSYCARDQRWNWLGHILRMEGHWLTRQVLLKCVKLTPEFILGDVPELEGQAAIEWSERIIDLLSVANLIRGLCRKQYNTIVNYAINTVHVLGPR